MLHGEQCTAAFLTAWIFQWQQKMAPWQAAQFEWINYVPTTILGKRILRIEALEYLVLLILGKVKRTPF